MELLQGRGAMGLQEAGDERAVVPDVREQPDGSRRPQKLPVPRIGRILVVVVLLVVVGAVIVVAGVVVVIHPKATNVVWSVRGATASAPSPRSRGTADWPRTAP